MKAAHPMSFAALLAQGDTDPNPARTFRQTTDMVPPRLSQV
jgi:hypothetical protein